MRQTTLCFSSTPKKSAPAPKIDTTTIDEPVFTAKCDSIFESPEEFAKCLEPSWREALSAEIGKSYFASLLQELRRETRTVFPPKDDVLSAFALCPFAKVKVVVIGQDPYHEPRQAHGISFSVQRGVPIPRSLHTIYKELADEYSSFGQPSHGCLESWARQGVLMLNATLTVVEHQANAHAKIGWLNFTRAAIDAINAKLEGVVFLAWGNFAKGVCAGINKSKHVVLTCGHPSPLSMRFFLGCGHFKKVNEHLAARGQTPIKWSSVND